MNKVVINSFYIIGIAVRTSNNNGQGSKDISALWEKFFTEKFIDKIPNKIDSTLYGLYTDYEGDYTKPYTAIVGCKVDSLNIVPEGMTHKIIPGGEFLKFCAKGNLNDGVVGKEWSKIWELGSSLDRAYTNDFELYGEKSQNPTDAEVDIFIALK